MSSLCVCLVVRRKCMFGCKKKVRMGKDVTKSGENEIENRVHLMHCLIKEKKREKRDK